MKEFSYVITDPQGIHARPAGMLVKEANKFGSKLTIAKGETKVNGKGLLSLMGLGVKKGEEIVLTLEGEDEVQAAEALETFLKENL